MSTEVEEGRWQVTCPCGWRTHGTRSEVVANVQAHARSAHTQELTADDVMQIAIRAESA